MQLRILELSEQVAVLSRMLFGRSSEKTGVDAGAGGGRVEDAEDPSAGHAGQSPSTTLVDRGRRGQRPGSKGHGRRDYSELDSEEQIHDVPAEARVCPTCSQELEVCGSACSEQIDWRVTITRIVHRRLRYRRRCDCPGPRTVIAPVAPSPIRTGRFTAAFLARLLCQKYVLGMPVHRITRALAADGLDLAQGSVTGALKAVADLLVPLEEAIVARNAHAVHVHAEETSWRVFEQIEGKDGHRWWLWVFIGRGHGRVPDGPHWLGYCSATALRYQPRRRCRGLRAAACCCRQTSIPPTHHWPGWTALTRCGAGRIFAGTSSAPVMPTSNCGPGGMRGWPGSRICTWLTGRWPPLNPPP